MNTPKVNVLVLHYNDYENLSPCIRSLENQSYKNIDIWIVDNYSKKEQVLKIEKNFSQIKLIKMQKNLGFAGAYNIAMKKAFLSGSEFCLLVNSDTEADKEMIKELINTYKAKSSETSKIGLLQPSILLHSERSQINTVGNEMHYLGFGYCKDFGKAFSNAMVDEEIVSVSGASLLVSDDYFREVGEMDEEFFLYNEDQNYSWRGLLLGFHHYVSSKAIQYHKYDFSRNSLKMYHSEKNRLMMIIENYEGSTLLKLLPILIINELMLHIHSILEGWFTSKVKANWYVISHLRNILKKRRFIQEKRKVHDSDLLPKFSSSFHFKAVDGAIIRRLVNPLFTAYYRLAFGDKTID